MSEFLRSYLTVGIFFALAGALLFGILSLGKGIRPTRPQPAKDINYQSAVDPARCARDASCSIFSSTARCAVFDFLVFSLTVTIALVPDAPTGVKVNIPSADTDTVTALVLSLTAGSSIHASSPTRRTSIRTTSKSSRPRRS